MSDTDYPGIIEITGPDSRRLLQGQCTADAAGMAPGQWSLGGLSTPKGRLYATFYLAALSDDCFWLLPPRRQIPELLQRFGKYAAFYKVDLTDRSMDYQGSIRAMASEEGQPQESAPLTGTVAVTNGTVAQQIPAFGIELAWRNTESPADSGLAEDAAHQLARLEIRTGIAWIQPETTELFLPQSLNWDRLGGVSFSKGCYTGQEVIARLHYKGSSKRAVWQVAGEGTPPQAGERLTSIEAGKALGNIARALDTGDGHWIGLAVINGTHSTGQLPDGRELRIHAPGSDVP